MAVDSPIQTWLIQRLRDRLPALTPSTGDTSEDPPIEPLTTGLKEALTSAGHGGFGGEGDLWPATAPADSGESALPAVAGEVPWSWGSPQRQSSRLATGNTLAALIAGVRDPWRAALRALGLSGAGEPAPLSPFEQEPPEPTSPTAEAAAAEDFGVVTPYSSVTATGVQNIDALLYGTKWSNPSALTYSFTDSISDYEASYPNLAGHTASFQALTSAQIEAARSWIGTNGQYFNVAATLTPTEKTGADDRNADLRFARSTVPTTAFGYYPQNSVAAGDTWYNSNRYLDPQIGTYDYRGFGHELGHALGLKHGQETGGVANTALSADRDSMEFSIMTYRSFIGQDLTTLGGYTNAPGHYAQTLMMYDIAAIQTLYGASFTSNASDTIYSFSATSGEMFIDGVSQGTPAANVVFRTIWDGNGIDTYDLSNYSSNQSINLEPGSWTSFDSVGTSQKAILNNGFGGSTVYARANIFNALQYNNDARSLIENAIAGIGNDVLSGNAAANSLVGGTGNDTLLGLGGTDTLDGGLGVDSMNGGAGNDLLLVDDALDVVTESSDDSTGGTADTVLASVTYILGSGSSAGQNGFGVENLTLTGSAIINGTGNGKANRLIGNSADNVLNGGLGIDTMNGGGGNDVVVVDNSADVATETTDDTDGGTADTVQASVTYTLGSGSSAGQNGFGIENLTLTGSATINGTGNGKANRLIGNSAANVLDGGLGIDTLNGGGGNDTYIVDDSADWVTESTDDSTGGTADTVQASVTYTLGNGSSAGQNGFGIENLTLTGSATINGTGNGKANRLIGNSAANVLDGGLGIDTLNGGGGNDTYIVDDSADWVTESTDDSTGGTADTVQASVTYTLGSGRSAGQNGFGIENLTLTGSATINGTGNGKANRLIGNSGNNSLRGNGGADTITSGAGTDTIILSFGSFGSSASSTASTTDWCTDLTTGTDKIDLITSSGGALAAPTSLSRMADNGTATSKDALATAMFSGLGANGARLCRSSNAALNGRVFLAINNSTASYSNSADLFLEVTGLSSLPNVGTITVNTFFV